MILIFNCIKYPYNKQNFVCMFVELGRKELCTVRKFRLIMIPMLCLFAADILVWTRIQPNKEFLPNRTSVHMI